MEYRVEVWSAVVACLSSVAVCKVAVVGVPLWPDCSCSVVVGVGGAGRGSMEVNGCTFC